MGEKMADLIFLVSTIIVDDACSHEIKRYLLLGRKPMRNLDSILESRDITFLTKVCIVRAIVFSSSYAEMWELEHKEGWTQKNSCFETVVLEKTLESPLDSKAIKPVNPKENQPWIFIGKTAVEAEAPILGPPDARTDVLGKTEGGKRRGWQRMRWLWHHQLNGHEFEQTLGDSEGQGGLVCSSPWGHKESDDDWATNTF